MQPVHNKMYMCLKNLRTSFNKHGLIVIKSARLLINEESGYVHARTWKDTNLNVC